MQSLILTTDISSAGRIKASRIADRTIGMCQRLIEGPLPSGADDTRFFGSVQIEDELHDEPHHWQSCAGFWDRRKLGSLRPSLVEICRSYSRIEIWVDPAPNAYLILFQILEIIGLHPDLMDRVSLAFPTHYVGSLSEAEFESRRPFAQLLTSGQLDLASRAWHAHRQTTPETWFALLHDDLTAIPGLRVYVLRILAELPSATNGLAASEAQLMALISSNDANHRTVFGRYSQLEPRPTLDYWEAGQRIVSLSRCEPPLITGVDEDRFSLELHDDKARFEAYLKRSWALSALGERIAAGLDDMAAFVTIDRCLGNTHLTPDRLWRWNATAELLVAPV